MSARGKLTAKQQMFVKEYLIDLNATQAAIRSGYSKGTASQIGHENLMKPDILAALEEANKERQKEANITPAMVLKELAALAFVDVRAAFDENGNLLPVPDMPENVAKAIGGFDVSIYKDKNNDGIETITNKVKFIDKKGALDLLGKHFSLFTEKLDLTNSDGTLQLSDLELARRMALLLQKGEQEAAKH